MALDPLLAREGGVCKVLNTLCCFSLPDYYNNITSLIDYMRNSIRPPSEADDSWFAWLTSILGPWGHWMITVILPIVCVFLIIMCLLHCILNCASNMIICIFTQYQMVQVTRETEENDDDQGLKYLYVEVDMQMVN
ncbi:hypothetical protein MHYP_G00234640 [Metynnis hypsauchen]